MTFSQVHDIYKRPCTHVTVVRGQMLVCFLDTAEARMKRRRPRYGRVIASSRKKEGRNRRRYHLLRGVVSPLSVPAGEARLTARERRVRTLSARPSECPVSSLAESSVWCLFHATGRPLSSARSLLVEDDKMSPPARDTAGANNRDKTASNTRCPSLRQPWFIHAAVYTCQAFRGYHSNPA